MVVTPDLLSPMLVAVAGMWRRLFTCKGEANSLKCHHVNDIKDGLSKRFELHLYILVFLSRSKIWC